MKVNKIDKRYKMHAIAKYALRFDTNKTGTLGGGRTDFTRIRSRLLEAYPNGVWIIADEGMDIDPTGIGTTGVWFYKYGDENDFIYLTTDEQRTFVGLM